MSAQGTQEIIDALATASRSHMGRMSAAQLDRGWDRLERALVDGKYPKVPVMSTARRWWMPCFALGAAALLVLAVHGRSPRQPAPLRYAIEGAALGPGESIQTTAERPARLLFSDDSRIRVAPSTRVSITAVGPHGSHIALADGELDVDVRHLPGAAWRFDAGPFSVKVIGTAFRLDFDAQRGRLRMHMQSGMVEVRGPTPDRVTPLRAGESVELFANPAATPANPPPVESTTPVAPPASGAPAEEPAPAQVAPAPRRRSARAERPDVAPEAGRWPRLIAGGDFAAVVKEAQGRGLDSVLAGASAADLNALADAARYIRQNDLARQALLGLRARFAGTSRASDAAFFLGRLAESSPAATHAAVRWYETYLAESPRGPYADEALGRQVAILARTDRVRARAAAAAYLERLPHGPEADLARSLLVPSP